MKRSFAVETEETDSSTETESSLGHTPRRMSDPEIETSSSETVTSGDVERQIRAVTDPLTQQLAHLCELLKELQDEQTHKRHEETASSRAVSTSAGNTSWSDTDWFQNSGNSKQQVIKKFESNIRWQLQFNLK